MRFQGMTSSDRERRVFRRRRQRPVPSPWRQGLDGVLMVLLGVGSLALLTWLPQRIDPLLMVSEMIADLIRGLAQLLEALLGLGSVLVLAAVLMLGLVCLCGGSVRLGRALMRIMRSPPSPQRRKRAAAVKRSAGRQRIAPSRRTTAARRR